MCPAIHFYVVVRRENNTVISLLFQLNTFKLLNILKVRNFRLRVLLLQATVGYKYDAIFLTDDKIY